MRISSLHWAAVMTWSLAVKALEPRPWGSSSQPASSLQIVERTGRVWRGSDSQGGVVEHDFRDSGDAESVLTRRHQDWGPPTVINVYWHLFKVNETASGGNIQRIWLEAELAFISDIFRRHSMPFVLHLVDVDSIYDGELFHRAYTDSFEWRTATSKNRMGSAHDLNIYSVKAMTIGGDKGAAIGYTPPIYIASEDDVLRDYVVITTYQIPRSLAQAGGDLMLLRAIAGWIGVPWTPGKNHPDCDVLDTYVSIPAASSKCPKVVRCLDGRYQVWDSFMDTLPLPECNKRFRPSEVAAAVASFKRYRARQVFRRPDKA